MGRSGEQQFALHARWAGTAGDPGLLVAALHPVREPEEATVAVQRVGSDRPGNQSIRQLVDRWRPQSVYES